MQSAGQVPSGSEWMGHVGFDCVRPLVVKHFYETAGDGMGRERRLSSQHLAFFPSFGTAEMTLDELEEFIVGGERTMDDLE